MSTKVLYTVEMLSDEIGTSVHTIREWARLGKIPASKFGKRYYFEIDKVRNVIMKRKLK
jgi:excisionase family DNA binding protein